MFAYLLIAFEIIMLSSVLYFVFLREPRPFEIKEDIWGYYPGDGADTEYGATSGMRKSSHRVHPEEVFLRSARHGVRRSVRKKASHMSNGWTSLEQSKQPGVLSLILAFLAAKIAQLSVRLS